ncbi:MAG: hypothetical protein U1F23_09225 [Lysobacterales bacterium]
MTLFYVFLGLIAVRIVLESSSGTVAALITIVAGVGLSDAVGGGWFGWLLAGLLFLAVTLVRNPCAFAQGYRMTRGQVPVTFAGSGKPAQTRPHDAYGDILLSREEVTRLAEMFPESDSATVWQTIIETRQLLASLHATADTPGCSVEWEEARKARQHLTALLAAGGTPDDGCTANPGPPRQG